WRLLRADPARRRHPSRADDVCRDVGVDPSAHERHRVRLAPRLRPRFGRRARVPVGLCERRLRERGGVVREHFLEKITWPEVEAVQAAGVDAVLLPIGSTEQHGRHMPLDTDCLIARELCRLAAEAGEREGVSLLVAPTLNVTLSWYHMQFPGSLRLSTTTFLHVFREVCDSLAHHGFDRLIAVNGHGGNIAALTVAVNYTMETTGRRVFLVQWWDLAADILADVDGPMIHAEEAETSIAL